MLDRLCRCWPGRSCRALGRSCLAILLCGVTVAGCRRVATAPTTSAPAAEIVLKTPPDATRSLLDALRGQLQATAHGDRAAARRSRDEVVEHIAAREPILARYRALPARVPQSDTEVLDALVENWASIVSYYADGLALNEMKLGAAGAAGSSAVVDVPARGPQDRALLRVACVRSPDDEWHVLGIGLEPLVPATPATQPGPASQPK